MTEQIASRSVVEVSPLERDDRPAGEGRVSSESGPPGAQTLCGDHALTGVAAIPAGRPAYMRRRRARQAVEELKRQIVFGLVIGWLMTLIGWFRYEYVPNVNDSLWLAVMWTGVGILVAAVVAPGMLNWPERLWMGVARFVGKIVFTGLLAILYFVMVTPIGLLMRALSGSDPFYAWKGSAPSGMEGWVRKDLPGEIRSSRISGRKRLLLLEPIRVFSYFVRQGHYLVLPLLVIVLVLGLLLFFVQSSALAPLIYTLF